MDDHKVIFVASQLNCKVAQLPFLYLGLPLGGYPKKVSFCQPVISAEIRKMENV